MSIYGPNNEPTTGGAAFIQDLDKSIRPVLERALAAGFNIYEIHGAACAMLTWLVGDLLNPTDARKAPETAVITDTEAIKHHKHLLKWATGLGWTYTPTQEGQGEIVSPNKDEIVKVYCHPDGTPYLNVEVMREVRAWQARHVKEPVSLQAATLRDPTPRAGAASTISRVAGAPTVKSVEEVDRQLLNWATTEGDWKIEVEQQDAEGPEDILVSNGPHVMHTVGFEDGDVYVSSEMRGAFVQSLLEQYPEVKASICHPELLLWALRNGWEMEQHHYTTPECETFTLLKHRRDMNGPSIRMLSFPIRSVLPTLTLDLYLPMLTKQAIDLIRVDQKEHSAVGKAKANTAKQSEKPPKATSANNKVRTEIVPVH